MHPTGYEKKEKKPANTGPNSKHALEGYHDKHLSNITTHIMVIESND
jgi:hypothetical protein